jgi:hypothetical protein
MSDRFKDELIYNRIVCKYIFLRTKTTFQETFLEVK